MIDLPPDDASRDEVLEFAARLIEEPSLTDLRGVWAKKKRAREDAELRHQVIQEVRREMAAHVRAFKSRDDLSPVAVLRRLAELGDHNHDIFLRDAWPLAWKGLVEIEHVVVVNSNSVPPESRYRIRLTEEGRAMIAAAPDCAA